MNSTPSIETRLVRTARARPALRARLSSVAHRIGYDTTHWCRAVMYDRCFAEIAKLGPESLDVLEISGTATWRDRFDFRSYRAVDYPDFDICAETVPDQQFDLIIADQVFEHLRHPIAAVRNVRAMLKPGGRFLVLTPFLILIHPCPLDVHRWTEDGLKFLLADNGFDEDQVLTSSWGNRKAARRHLSGFPRVGFGKDLRNEPGFPLVVWGWAQA